jgi:zinc protease
MAFAGVSFDELAGQFVIWADLKPDVDVSVASEAMDRVVGELVARGPTSVELERAIATVTSNLVSTAGDGNGRAGTLAAGELYAGDPAFMNRYLQWLDAATTQDVQDVARAYLAKGWHQTEVLPRRVLATESDGPVRPHDMPAVSDQLPNAGFPAISVSRLDNGARLVVAERHNAPQTFISVQFDAGNAADPAGKPGVAAFAVDLLDEGTRSRSALQIAAEAARLGADLATFSDLDSSGVRLMALPSRLDDSIALWADVVQNAAFADAQIERVRAARVAAIGNERSDAEAAAFRILRGQSFGARHAYGIPRSGLSDSEAMRAITRDDLLAFRRSWLRPDNATIFVVGDTTPEQMKSVLNRVFRGWHAPAEARREKTLAMVARQTAPRLILVDRPGAPQSLILAGDIVPSSAATNELAIELANSVLGAQFTSRLNMNLREAKHWSYGVTSGMADARGQRSFQINAPVETDRTADALAELQRELQAINGERPISEAELSAAKASAIRQLPGAFEHAGAVLASLQTSAALGRPFDYPNAVAQRYESLTLEDVRAAAREIVHPDSMIWIVVGDRSRIEKQIAELHIARIEHWTADGRPTE